MRAVARFAGFVALMVVFALLGSGIVTMGLSSIFALREAPEGTPFEDAMSAFVESDTPIVLALGIVPTSLAFFALGMSLARKRRHEMRFVPARPLDFVIAALGMVSISTAAGALVALLGLVDGQALAKLNDMFMNMPWSVRIAMLPVTALCPGIAEEVFFRGYVLGRGQERVGTVAAVIISSLAFGAVHVDPGHVIAAAIMGGYLAFVVLRTGSLFVTIVAHIINNGVATLAPELNSSGVDDVAESVYALIIGAAAGLLMMAAIARRNPVTRDRTPAAPLPDQAL